MQTLRILLLSSAIFLAFTQQTCDNPILTNLQINETTVTTPLQLEDLDICGDLEESTSCCSLDTINGFQSTFDSRAIEIESLMAQQDERFQTFIEQDYADYRKNVSELNQELERIQQFNDDVYNQLVIVLDPIIETSNAFSAAIDEAIGNFGDYQSQRKQCMESLLDLQASATCLACDSNAENLGVTPTGNINLSDDTCKRITDDCKDYLEFAVRLSILGAIQPVNQQISEVIVFLGTINPPPQQPPVVVVENTTDTDNTANTTTNLTDITQPEGPVEGVDVNTDDNGDEGELVLTNTTNTTQGEEITAILEKVRAFQLPQLQIGDANVSRMECSTEDNDSGCQWLCSTVFNNGNPDYNALLLGGGKRSSISNEQLLTISEVISGEQNEDDLEALIAQDVEDIIIGTEGEDVFVPAGGVTWNPDNGDSNIDIDLDENPADVDLGETQDTVDDETESGSENGGTINTPGSGSRLAISFFAMIAGLYVAF